MILNALEDNQLAPSDQRRFFICVVCIANSEGALKSMHVFIVTQVGLVLGPLGRNLYEVFVLMSLVISVDIISS